MEDILEMLIQVPREIQLRNVCVALGIGHASYAHVMRTSRHVA